MEKERKLEAIFEKNFVEGMINKDYAEFKKTHPTLHGVILKTLKQIGDLSKNNDKHSVQVLSVENAFDKLAHAVLDFKDEHFLVDQIKIYCPNWYKKLLVSYTRRVNFISDMEPARFMGVDIVDGYENALIVAANCKSNNPFKISTIRIELILI